MKTTKLMVAIIIALTCVISTFTASAQSKSLPIDSLGAAVSHNLMLVSRGYGSLNCNSLVNTNGVKTFWWQNYNPNGVPKIGDLTAMSVTNPFAFMVARPTNDSVSADISYISSEGYQLFYGWTDFMLEKTNGVWRVPESALTNMQYSISYLEPIAEMNAVGAYLNLRDTNGYPIQRIYLQVDRNSSSRIGTILNLTQYLGQHGEMFVTYAQYDQYGNITNTFDVAFSMEEGKGGVALPSAMAKAAFTPSWGNLAKELQPPIVALTNVPSWNHVGTSQLVEITVKTNMMVYFSAQTTEGEDANGFTVKILLPGMDLPPVPYYMPQGVKSLGVELPPGTYHIDFLWPMLAPQQINPWWWYGTPVTPSVKGG